MEMQTKAPERTKTPTTPVSLQSRYIGPLGGHLSDFQGLPYGLASRMAALEASMMALAAAMTLQRTALEATNATLQDTANRISALEQKEPEVRTSTRFIPVPVESE